MSRDATTSRSIYQQRRWMVYLLLIATFAASLFLFLLHLSTTTHVLFGVSFAVCVAVHLIQRKRRVRGLLSELSVMSRWWKRPGRLAWSDAILTFLFANLIASGLVDYFGDGRGVFLHLGVIPQIRWHSLSAILLLGDLVVHVVRRAARLKISTVN